MNSVQDSSHEISVGHSDFIAKADAWNEAQAERAGQLPELISESGVTTVRVVYSDQHGIMRGKSVKHG